MVGVQRRPPTQHKFCHPRTHPLKNPHYISPEFVSLESGVKPLSWELIPTDFSCVWVGAESCKA